MSEKLVLTERERMMLRALIMVRQAGNASGSLSFLLRTEDDNEKKKTGLLEHLKCDLGNLILQGEMLAQDLGFDINEVKQMAKERHNECKEEFKSNGKSAYFI